MLGPGDGERRGETDELEVSWDLTFTDGPEAFRHLPYDFLYRRAAAEDEAALAPTPTRASAARSRSAASGSSSTRWPGMIGHNWGAEHAERWIWMQANEFARRRRLLRRRARPDQGRAADDAVDRQRGAVRSTASATGSAASTGSARPRSTSEPTECEFELTGKDIRVRGRVASEPRNFVAWVYADPVGPEHNTVNCSISDLELMVERKGARAAAARVRRRRRVRARDARDRPRHPAAAVSRRLSARLRTITAFVI